MPASKLQRGFTLVELMITIAILSVVAALAIPAYNGYILEARLGAARANMEPLRLALEEYWLEEGSYVAGVWDPKGTKTLETGNLGWSPDGDQGAFTYNVALITNGYTITVIHAQATSDPVTESFVH